MALTKYKIGELVQLIDERNNIGLRNFYGINIDKEFMPTVASTDLLDETKYKVVRKNRFVYSGMQTGRDKCIRIGLYSNDTTIIVSPAYITFEIKATDIIIPQYFFMLFLSKEKDRLGWFYSDGSIRSNLDCDVFCDIELNLPSIEIQQKYVDIYNAMVANQKAYEEGLDDLKLVCDAMIDDIKRKSSYISVDKLVKEVDVRNTDYHIKDIKGINIFKDFMPSVVSVKQENLKTYKVVQKGQFAFSGMQTGRDLCIRIALHKDDEPIIISPAYIVLEMCNDDMLAEFFMLWFSRNEIDRYGWFVSDGSIRANLDMDRFYEMQIPIPDIKIQQSIVDIYNQYITRKEINEKLKTQIKDLCPILIKGSLQEA